MDNYIRILYVDDDPKILDAFKESVEEENKASQDDLIQYEMYEAHSYEEALDRLNEIRIDVAVIDLDLKDKFNGEDIAKYISKHYRIPIFIATGTPNAFNSELGQMVNVLNRDDSDLFDKIKKQMQSRLVRFFSKNNGFLERQIVDFFWEHVSKNLEYWEKCDDLILLRHTTACLNEKLYVSDSDEKYFNEYHPGEMYIYPPIKDIYHTGDIVKKDDDFFVILNPSCDLVNKKFEYYILARIVHKEFNGNKPKECFYPIVTFAKIFEVENKNKEILKPHIYFQDLTSVKKEGIFDYNRVASISYPFLKDIIAKFSGYYARQGSPEILKNTQ